jgi:hypothetical protein
MSEDRRGKPVALRASSMPGGGRGITVVIGPFSFASQDYATNLLEETDRPVML